MGPLLALILLLPALPAGERSSPPNVLLIVADDLGTDNVAVYGDHPDPALTPTLDGLAASGVRFDRAYANPVCTPTRATLLTGRACWRTGMGGVLDGNNGTPLSAAETTLPEALAPAGYTSAAVGKWHLGDAPLHPLQAGFQHHRGSLNNLPNDASGYFLFEKNVDGTLVLSTTYATTDTVDDALALMAELPEPWFLYVGFNAAHVPFHKPPAALHPYALPDPVAGNEPIHSKAMIAAMDTELGRLLAGLGGRTDTLIVFTSDNGPEPLAVTPPWDPTKAKRTCFEHGIRVPLIVAGPGVVQGAVCDALVQTTDLFASLAQLAGVPHDTAVDSVSLLPYLAEPSLPSLRSWIYSETFRLNFDPAVGPPPGGFQRRLRAVRDERYKLILTYLPFSPLVDPGKRLFFDLLLDPDEEHNLLDQPLDPEQLAAYTDLQVLLVENGIAPWTDLGHALAGTHGPPALQGGGTLVPHAPFSLALSGALEGSLSALVIGATAITGPLLCGTLVPAPDEILFLLTDGGGGFAGQLPWPPLPPALSIYFQVWTADPGAPCGWSASNALVAVTAP